MSGMDLDADGRTDRPIKQENEAPGKSNLLPEVDMGEVELAEILDIPAVQALMESFYELVHIPMAIVDIRGRVLVGVGWQDVCTRFHRVHPETCRYCIESDTQLSSGIPAGEFKRYRCKNNMWDIATPIMVGGRHLGNVFSGQFFFDDEPLDYERFRFQARRYGFPEEEYIAALERVPKLSRKFLDNGMAFFVKLAQMFSQLSYSNAKLSRSLKERQVLMSSLQAAEEKYRGIFENSIEGIYRSTPEGTFVEINPTFARILGYDSPEELKNAAQDIGWQFYVEPEKRRDWLREVAKRDYGSFDIQIRTKDGCIRWISNKARVVRDENGKPLFFDGFIEDITERKRTEEELKKYRDNLEERVRERTVQLEERNRQLVSEVKVRTAVEEALRESENKYRTIFENTGTATLIYGEDSTISLVNAEFEKMFHYAKDEVEGKKSWSELVLKEDLGRLMEYHRLRGIDSSAVPRNYELKVVDRYGHLRDVYMTVALIPGTQNRVAALLDITPLKKMEKALRESETLYRNLFENASIGMFQTTLEGRFLRINKALAAMLGYESTDEVISTITDTATQIHADPANRAELLAALKQRDWFYAEQPYFRKDGSIMIGKLAIRRVLGPDGTVAYLEGIVEDITERKRVEEALLEREKELQIKARNLMEVNTTLKVLLTTMEKDQEELKERFLANIRKQVLPYLERLKKTPLNEVQKGFIKAAETGLNEIASPFVRKLTSSYLNLTKKEVQIALLIREGKTSKEIAELLNSKKRVIEFHRENIRKKLGLKNRKDNLQIFLRSFS